MELAIGALELQNSLYFSLFAGNCVGDRFAGDCFHHHCFAERPPRRGKYRNIGHLRTPSRLRYA